MKKVEWKYESLVRPFDYGFHERSDEKHVFTSYWKPLKKKGVFKRIVWTLNDESLRKILQTLVPKGFTLTDYTVGFDGIKIRALKR